jgi:DoxX-like family
MAPSFVIVTGLTAAANIAAAAVDFRRARWVLANMTSYGVPHSWLVPLGAAKLAGALGLLVGIAVPVVGLAAALGLVLYFVGAAIAVVRARRYSHLLFPGVFLLLAAASLALRLAEL